MDQSEQNNQSEQIVKPIIVTCGSLRATLYVINYEPKIESEYDVSNIYEEETLVLKRIDSIITALNIYCLSEGDEDNCLSFIRNKFRNDFNDINLIVQEMYVEFLLTFVASGHFLVTSLKNAFTKTVTISLKYSTGKYLSGDLEELMKYSESLKGDERTFILIAFFGKLLCHLPNNAYLQSVCKLIRRLIDCDPCIARDAPEEPKKWYDAVQEPKEYNTFDIDSDTDSVGSIDKYDYFDRYNRLQDNRYDPRYDSYYGSHVPLASESNKDKAARAIDEYYSKDTIMHQIEWHEKWIAFYKEICPESTRDPEDTDTLLYEFTSVAFEEKIEPQEKNTDVKVYADGLDDISVNSYSVHNSEDPLDNFDDPELDFGLSNFENKYAGLLTFYDPEESTGDVLERDMSPRNTDWIWELD